MASMNVRKVTMRQYREEIETRLQMRLLAVKAKDFGKTNLPLFVWGMPGTAKSQIASSVAEDSWRKAKNAEGKPMFDKDYLSERRPWDYSNWQSFKEADRKNLHKHLDGVVLMDVRLSQIDPVEIKGAPYYDLPNKQAGFVRFSSILPDPTFPHPVILMLDEFPLAPDMVQSAGYQLVNERKVGDYRLPERCITLAAGNPPECPGTHFEMGLAMENRFDHIILEIDYDGFIKYMSRPEHKYDPTVLAFLQFSRQGEKEVIYNVERMMGKGNFPTFRSWEKAAVKIKYGYNEYNAIADSVGQVCAAKYESFKELTKDIPQAEVLVKDKLYYEQVEMQLVASQKVGNLILQEESLAKMTDDKAFEAFRYFVEMKNPKDATDNREELTVLFLVNLRDVDFTILEKLNKGFEKALKKGTIKVEKNAAGEDIKDIYGFITHKWSTLATNGLDA
jgi:hypothetical protein